MEEDIIITLYMKKFSSPGLSSMMHRQIQCYFQLLAVLTQPVSEGALDGYTEANHKILASARDSGNWPMDSLPKYR